MNHDPDLGGARRAESLELLTIGEVSTKYDVTLRALRFYESRGLLRPRRIGAVRLYDPRDTRRLELILKGKQLGFTLTEIRDMLAAETGAEAETDLAIDPGLVASQLDSLRRQRANLDVAIAELEATHDRMQAAAGTMGESARSIETHAA